MFVRRRGCRLQIVRAFRDENGKPANETFGTVGVFDKKIKPEVAEQLSRSDQKWLRGEMEREAAVCVAESREILGELSRRADTIDDNSLAIPEVYTALTKIGYRILP
jgi:hypothetical protein